MDNVEFGYSGPRVRMGKPYNLINEKMTLYRLTLYLLIDSEVLSRPHHVLLASLGLLIIPPFHSFLLLAPRPMAAQRQETQPTTYKPTLKALLALPIRICNPPPAVGKVRSCGVTPLIRIRLEDVLDRKHLPPLGLKDFEEWLLYVENCPENLYFTLWLKEYTAKYHQWAGACKAQRQMAGQYRDQLPTPCSSQLAMFYARAKQTFFMPNSTYELDLPSDILAPFHAPAHCQHPDPIIFHEVSQETHRTLEKCLGRFVNAQLNNVGNNRVLCGIIAGVVFCLLGALPPIVINFTHNDTRWSRLAAFPGMWIGLTILLAALNGICLGVYVFGDLRQLHKFELVRPPISKPRPLSKQPISLPITAPPPPPNMVIPLMQPPRLSIVPPSPAHIVDHALSRTSTISSSTMSSGSCSGSSCSGSSYEMANPRIEISAAYYDTDPVDGPATSPIAADPNFTFPAKVDDVHCVDSLFTNTAAFIHPYDSTVDSDSDYDIPRLPEERQPMSPFDFDALPHRSPGHCRSLPNILPSADHEILEIKSDVPPLLKLSASTLLEQIQLRCNIRKWLVVSREVAAETNATASPRSSFGQGRPKSTANPTTQRRQHQEKGVAAVRKQFKMVKAVPAFSSLTRILSPVVVRGQWEIVVRSAAISFVITWVVLGSLLAVPIAH
ncbi:hypothetical protein D9615_002933 [Tricholomella constricta]|uniref:Transmembrane protein n=1 Tax=Tricholomella constricta TaxID=117010 RepID=A0A8H5HGH2_9AGAR|nr:hypothetical protein D9615_002933 [Tricholomella constricta]